MKGKTVIYCAHRLSSIVGVDKIHVLKDGKVQEEGSHEKLLLDEKSLYSKMWKNQQMKPIKPTKEGDCICYKFPDEECDEEHGDCDH